MSNSKDLTDDEQGFEDDGVAVEGEEEVNLLHQTGEAGGIYVSLVGKLW